MLLKRFRRVMAFLACFGFVVSSAQVVTAEAETNNDSPLSISDTAEGNSEYQSFLSYKNSLTGKPDTATPIELKSDTALVSEQRALIREDKTIMLQSADSGQSAGWVEWEFTAPEDAVYYLELRYMAYGGKGNKPLVKVDLDGMPPYNELAGYSLNRIYQDANAITQDEAGNDRIPDQKEVSAFQTVLLYDTAGYSNSPMFLYLSKGSHKLRITCEEEALNIDALKLTKKPVILDDDKAREIYQSAGLKDNPSYFKEIQAEKTYEKSDSSLYPQYDRTSPATVPYHPTLIRRNTIGGSGWSKRGMWISYVVEDIPADGLYYLTIKFRQKEAVGVTTFRNIYINGTIPSASFENAAFPYGINWQSKTIVGQNGEPCPVYLNKGRNEIKFEVGAGRFSEVLGMVDSSSRELNHLYTQMVMITGVNPDPYRDYYLDKEIPGLVDAFKKQAQTLYQAADLFDRLSGEKSSESETVRDMARRLDSMVASPSSIHKRLSSYRNGISSLYGWLDDMTFQPLEMDYLIIHSRDSRIPSAQAGLGARLKHELDVFINSFLKDYNNVGGTGGKEAIDVWVSMGRDQIQIIRNMVTDQFTPKTGIKVNLSIVQTGFIEASLAGSGPDVAIGIARGQPVNLASRNALLDFDGYDGFATMKDRFSKTALIPYQFNEKTYALPCSQTYYMLFYRSDILSQLEIDIPRTWEDIRRAIPKLQRSHMSIGLPYSVISAAAAVDTGLGAKDLYATLLLQNGGRFYADDHTKTLLSEEEAVSAFKTWCDFYTQYGFDLVYDFYTRFKNGEMPMGIASFEMFNVFSLAAREINGLWGMTPVPGIMQADGTINNAEAGAGTAAVIFKNTKSPQACYRFLDWWTSDNVQTEFSRALETALGPGGRYPTANLKAFASQPWSDKQLALLEAQRNSVVELPEIPGSYYVSRSIDNAFRSVLYDGNNPREVFLKENRGINREIARKRRELGLS